MFFLISIFLAAFLISSVSAYFSIAGLTAIFPGATLPIMAMGIVLELGKLTAASFVYNYWKKTRFFTSVLLGMTVVLSLLSSVGVYGYLTRKHIEGTVGISIGSDEVAFVDSQIAMEKNNIITLQQSLDQGNKVINNYLTDSTKTTRAESARNKLTKEREKTQAEILAANKHLLDLQHQKDSLSQIQRVREVDVGPLKYLAALISKDMDIETVVKWFIFCLVLVLDPLAILLVVAANIHRKYMREIQPKGLSEDIIPIRIISPQTTESFPIRNDVVGTIDPEVGMPETPMVESETPMVESETPISEVILSPETPKELDFRLPEKWGT